MATERVLAFAEEFAELILDDHGYDLHTVSTENNKKYTIVQREKGVRYGLFSLEEVAEWIDRILYNRD